MPLKVLLLSYEYPPLGGGTANAVSHLLKAMATFPDLAIDLVSSSDGVDRTEQLHDNVTAYFLDVGKAGQNLHYQTNLNLLRYFWRASALASKLVRLHQYDIVHAFFSIPSGAIAMRLGLPYIISLRGSDVPFYNPRFYWADRLLFRRLNRRIWRNASKVVANSAGLRALAHQTDATVPIELTCNGVDTTSFFPPENTPALPFTALSVTRLIQRKGVEYLLQGFAKFHAEFPNSRLVIAGGGNLFPSLQQQAKELGVVEVVDFLGPVTNSNLPQVYRNAHAFVLASLNEGMSNAVLEAMASGLPIVATDTGGTSELVDPTNGIVVESASSISIAQALSTLYSNSPLRTDMGKQSRQKALLRSWASAAEQYREYYHEVHKYATGSDEV